MAMELDLPDDIVAIIRARVASGRYARAEDVVTAALRALEDQEWLKRAWDEGEASGDWQELDWAALRREAEARLRGA